MNVARNRGQDPNQLQLFGSLQPSVPAAVMPKLSPEAAAIIHGHLPPPDIERYASQNPADIPASEAVIQSSAPVPIALPWDFRHAFPAPLEDAIGVGVLSEDDRDGEAVRAIHEEHAAECLTLLADLDALEAARHEGVDPRTHKKPRTEKSRQRLERYLAEAPAALVSKFNEMMDAYENAFGTEAANAFRSVIHAWHRGVPVVSPMPSGMASEAIAPAASAGNTAIEITADHEPDELDPLGGPKLPIPIPLSEAVERGVFGYEENEEPINPAVEEVEAITAYHADRLMDLLDRLRAADTAVARATGTERAALYHDKDKALSAYQAALGLYAEDFGQEAARRLDGWVHHQVETDRGEVQYDPGHPWHYLDRGDGRDPMPVEEIRPSAIDAVGASVRLPRDPAKRLARLQEMLDKQKRQLETDRKRYSEIVDDGPAALSDFDRNIAHGGDEKLAWASAVAMKYSHIRHGMAWLAWIEQQREMTKTQPLRNKGVKAHPV